jgi:hypothetical protein
MHGRGTVRCTPSLIKTLSTVKRRSSRAGPEVAVTLRVSDLIESGKREDTGSRSQSCDGREELAAVGDGLKTRETSA